MSSVHVHLDRDNCLEVILVRGKSLLVKDLANALIATKGVKHDRFMLTTSGRDLPCVTFDHAILTQTPEGQPQLLPRCLCFYTITHEIVCNLAGRLGHLAV
jgi:NikR C terminal nickel binding domain